MMKQFSPSLHSAHVFSNAIVTQAVQAAWTGATGGIDERVENLGVMAEAIDMHHRSHLTAGVSHELRTPLTILKGRLHGIRDGVIDGTPDETERLLRQVDHILHIVDDLDALAHADTGRLVLQREGIDLEDVISPVVADLQPLLARHGLTLEGGYRRARVHGDLHRLQQVFTNLLTNAAKHSPRGGKVRVTVEVKDRQAVASVTDEGPGIAPGDEEHLFKPFWRSAATRNRPGCTGTGLGLALTARLVLAHGGRVEVANRTDRSGATFRVVLPLA